MSLQLFSYTVQHRKVYILLTIVIFKIFFIFSVAGKRRRSVSTEPIDNIEPIGNAEPIDNVVLVRNKRVVFNFTSKEKKCMKKCSSCSAFTSGVGETAMRASA